MVSTTDITLPNGVKYPQPTGLFIDNDFVPANGDEFTVYNPATDEDIITLKSASEEDVDIAVAAARRAFDEGEWPALSAADRGAFLYKIADLLQRDSELYAAIDAFDNGKPYSVALGEDLAESINVFRYYAGAADKISGRTIETSPAKLAYVLQEPLGVCGQIIPWYVPAASLSEQSSYLANDAGLLVAHKCLQELSHDDARLESGPSPRLRQHRRSQAC